LLLASFEAAAPLLSDFLVSMARAAVATRARSTSVYE
jgi:hypothetical protein